MLAYVLAFFLGVAISFGPLSFLSIPFASFASILVSYTQVLANFVIDNVTLLPESSKLVYYLVPLVSVSLPSFVALFTVLLASAVNSLKKFITLLGVLLAFSSYFFLPWTEATLVFIASVIFALLVNFIAGPLLIIPVVAFATTTGFNIALEVFKGNNKYVNNAVIVFQKAQPSTDPLIWKYALAFAALAPLVGIIGLIFNTSKDSNKKSG